MKTTQYIFVLLLISLIFSTPSIAAERNNLIGSKPPEFLLPDLNGRQHSLSQWTNRFIVLNFWATWCAPCKKEIPLFNEIQDDFSEDVQFIGIAIDNARDVKKFTQLIPINYPNLIGGINASKLIVEYGNKSGSLPYTVFIDRSGKIVTTATGKITKRFLLKVLLKHATH